MCVCVRARAHTCVHARMSSQISTIALDNHMYIYTHTYIFVLLSFVLIQTKNMLTIPGGKIKKVTGACICVPTCIFVCALMCECAYLRARIGACTGDGSGWRRSR